jgi:hypothetical protein
LFDKMKQCSTKFYVSGVWWRMIEGSGSVSCDITVIKKRKPRTKVQRDLYSTDY